MDAEKFYELSVQWLRIHGPSVLMAIMAFFIGQWCIRVIKKWLRGAMERRDISSSLRPFFQSLIITGLQVLLIIIVLQILSVRLTVFTAIVTSFGVAAGLALSGTLQNFTGGIVILLLKPFNVGDNIIAQGHDGIVESIEIFYTIITTTDNRTVIIPNSKLSNEVIVNISRQGSRRLDIELKLTYAHDIDSVRKILESTINAFPGVLKAPAPYVGVSDLMPDGYKLSIQTWIEALQYHDIRFELQRQVIEDLKKANIKLPGM